jgi:mono/diheme cytochrome c family protein
MTLPRAALVTLAVLLPVAAIAGETSIWPLRRTDDVDWGQGLYDKHCAHCHGRGAQGDGPAAAAMTVPVPALRGRSNDQTRGGFVTLARQGKGAMPAYQDSISRQDARRVFIYLEALDDPNRALPAEEDPEEDGAPVPEGDAPPEAGGDAPPEAGGDAPPEAGGDAEGGE